MANMVNMTYSFTGLKGKLRSQSLIKHYLKLLDVLNQDKTLYQCFDADRSWHSPW